MNKKNTIQRILILIKPHSTLAVVSLLLALVNVACSLYVPILIGRAIDHIIEPGKVDYDIIARLLITVAGALLFGALSQYFVSYISNLLSCRIVRNLRKDVFDHLMSLPLKYMDAHPAGDIISRVITDTDQFADGMLLGFTQLFTGMATIIGTLVFMFYLNPIIAVVVVFVTPLSFFVAKFIAGRTYNLFKEQSSIRGKQTSQIEEALSQVKVIRSFGCEEGIIEEFEATNEDLGKVSLKAIFYSSLTNPCTRFINSLVYALVALAGAFAVISGGMTVGVWSCFLNYANQYTKPFNEITGVITELQGSLACAVRIFELLDEKPEIPDAANAVVLSEVHGDIDIEHVDFSYVPEKPLINDFNLSVQKGQKIAIVGPTGCGKTTLINLLMRFYDPQSGTICVDGNEIKSVTRESLRQNYGMVLQDTWLRSGTIAENIKIGKGDATTEEIMTAAKQTGAHSFIRRLEKGYDTVIGEDGGALSAGQKQLLCITRIMLSLPPMLILDEATSNIDTRTEMKIQSAFLKLMEGKTSFIVAHRLATIIGSDCILVMKDGSVIEKGNHRELLQAGGFYSQLYKAGNMENESV